MVRLSKGADNPKKYRIVDDFGRSGEIERAVVPIFMEQNSSPSKMSFAGTGFFILQNVIVTARHVLKPANSWSPKYSWDDGSGDNPDIPGDQQAVIHIIHKSESGQFGFRFLRSAWLSEAADVAVAQIEGAEGWNNPNLPLNGSLPKVGDEVFTYGYPKTTINHKRKSRNISLNPGYFKGTVIEVFPHGRDSKNLNFPVFQVDFHLHGGASGGPVLDSLGRVIGLNCYSIKPHTNTAYVTAIAAVAELGLTDVHHNGVRHKVLSLRDLINDGTIRHF